MQALPTSMRQIGYEFLKHLHNRILAVLSGSFPFQMIYRTHRFHTIATNTQLRDLFETLVCYVWFSKK